MTHTTLYTYDANGNQLSLRKETIAPAGTQTEQGVDFDNTVDLYRTYSYNGFNQLAGAYVKGVDVTYTYNPNGLRRTKMVGDTTIQHLWDGTNMVAEISAGAVYAKYIRGIGLLAAIWGTETRYYLYNAHGDVVQLTNETAQIVWVYDYDAFGNQKDVEGYNSSLDTNPFRYCGEYFDAETGSIYLRARYYNPVLGRFMNEDPIRDGLNWYTYCGNNPVAFHDPSGLSLEALMKAVVIAAAAAASVAAKQVAKEQKKAAQEQDFQERLAADPRSEHLWMPPNASPEVIRERQERLLSEPERAYATGKPHKVTDFPNYATGAVHSGTDMPGAEGDPIYAVNRGYVRKIVDSHPNTYNTYYSADKGDAYANRINIETDDSYLEMYCHNIQRGEYNSQMPQEGDYVLEGDLIAFMGNTGNSDGHHLHFEAREKKNGNYNYPANAINPKTRLKP